MPQIIDGNATAKIVCEELSAKLKKISAKRRASLLSGLERIPLRFHTSRRRGESPRRPELKAVCTFYPKA